MRDSCQAAGSVATVKVMMHASRLLRRSRTFRALTGLSPAAFQQLAGEEAVAWAANRAHRLAMQARRRRPGGGPKFKLDLADRLLLVLIYYRTYVSQEFLGALFDIDAGTANRTLKALHPVLAAVFRIPERRIRLSDDELRELFFDGTEQAAYRPTSRQKRRYSGKKKRHTFKHQVVVCRVTKKPGPGRKVRKVRIKAVSAAFPGRVHDKKVYERCRMRIPPGVAATGDSGYQGTDLTTPRKKPRGGTLTRRQKAGNRRLSRRRIAVEHGIGKLKIWRSGSDRYRNCPKKKTIMFKNIAGLHNRMFG